MKISEVKERKIIHRPTQQFDEWGYRIYHAYEYYLPYNPGYKGNETERLFAKVIDMLPFFLIFFMLFKIHALISVLLCIPVVIISGTLTEMYRGTTLGKKIFRIKVLNDYGNYPGFLKSLQRNVLCLANFYPVFTDYIPPNSAIRSAGTQMNFSMHMNNKICKTYIVKESKIPEIKELLKPQESNQNLLL
ncbi:RDD family protein [Chryseobacterium tongliaoense]|uniref:RDD family protein n=1 Tax=Chryseobacterium tongliaoense TaxID=3240933 RepID=UPI0035199335